MKQLSRIINTLSDFKKTLDKENRILSYWENEFEKNPIEYINDTVSSRFVSLDERHSNRLVDDKNFIYSQGSFNRIMRWRGVPLYKNCYDYSIYPNILTELKPKTIFELGTGDGASCVWYRDILKSFNVFIILLSCFI